MAEADIDAFVPPAVGEHEPAEIAARLILEVPEFVDLRGGEASILFLLRTEPKVKAYRQVLGELALPRFMGALGRLAGWLLDRYCNGEGVDYIMILDSEWWADADPFRREALVHHELMHAKHATDKDGELKFDEDGRPVWAIQGHSLEEHNATVRRYGAWLEDIGEFQAALAEGEQRVKRPDHVAAH